jgi:large subunit ribosomal protein L23
MEFTDILIEPVITEKANALREENKYVFIVRPDASKIQIKEAVRKLFNVKVLSCTTINVAGKVKRLRGSKGMTASYRKAIVRVADGETIKLFE